MVDSPVLMVDHDSKPERPIWPSRDTIRDAVGSGKRELANRAGRGNAPDLAACSAGSTDRLGKPEIAVRACGDEDWK